MPNGVARYEWPLNTSNVTWSDRIKLAGFFLDRRNRWTQGERVMQFEREMAAFVGCRFAVFVSSGSTANTLLAMWTRDREEKRNVVVLPAVTWTTSCAPWIREGFTPHFIDVCRTDFSMNLESLEYYLRKHAGEVACVFITSLLGFSPDIEQLQMLASRFNVPVMMDNCESLLTFYDEKNLSSYFTSTTSTYFGHHIQSVEGGFVFTNDGQLYKYCLMARNHGMTRSLDFPAFSTEPLSSSSFRLQASDAYRNPDVDRRFDFYCLGSNFRNTDIHAAVGLLDLKRAESYARQRLDAYAAFRELLNPVIYHLPSDRRNCTDIPFALPVVRNNDVDSRREDLLAVCDSLGVESRPIISGNLLRHTAYRPFVETGRVFPVANILHNGIYIGLGSIIDYDLMAKLAEALNKIK